MVKEESKKLEKKHSNRARELGLTGREMKVFGAE